MQDNNHSSRRQFIHQSAMAGAGLMLAGALQVFSQSNQPIGNGSNIKSKGYAGKDEHGKLTAWNFERRPVGDNDILIEIEYSGICHSDIHTIRGHWGKQQYPQVAGHEIAGIVTALGKDLAYRQSKR
jgi:uncharacterized zinc-type alcohol dehydrogenase-like protein